MSKLPSQSGFSLVSAIFLVVVVALIAGFMVSIGGLQRSASANAVVAKRAHFAARSGIEWAVHQVLSNPAAPECFTLPTSFGFSGIGSGGMRVSFDCNETEVTEGAVSYSVFDLEAIAEFGVSGSEDYFRRVLSASVATPPM